MGLDRAAPQIVRYHTSKIVYSILLLAFEEIDILASSNMLQTTSLCANPITSPQEQTLHLGRGRDISERHWRM